MGEGLGLREVGIVRIASSQAGCGDGRRRCREAIDLGGQKGLVQRTQLYKEPVNLTMRLSLEPGQRTSRGEAAGVEAAVIDSRAHQFAPGAAAIPVPRVLSGGEHAVEHEPHESS